MSDRLRYRVEGMDCGSCARKIEIALTRVPGVSDINITTATETLRLRVAEAGTGEQVEKVVRDLGYGITLVREEARHHHDSETEECLVPRGQNPEYAPRQPSGHVNVSSRSGRQSPYAPCPGC